ncbi:hypothetical protein E4T56_gene13027 [Termitomyces sp. T112]|nr:hypothetical protein E4T56_gene13027 [Termitomyces sp. T112]
MFFGLTNSPTTFRTMMNDIFWNLIAEGVVTPSDHLPCLGTPLLAPALLQAKEVTVKMDLLKVAGVAEWPETKNKKKGQAFPGFTNFYQRFIQDFLHHAHLLFNLTGKDVAWSWEPLEQAAFNAHRCAMTSGSVLLFPDNNSPFWMEVDNSGPSSWRMKQ